MGRPHKDRLIYDFGEIRTELTAEVAKLKPEEFNWAPKPDMKSFKALLQEIGTMEKISINWVVKNSKEHVVAVCLETAWNTPNSTVANYKQVGKELGVGIEKYFRDGRKK